MTPTMTSDGMRFRCGTCGRILTKDDYHKNASKPYGIQSDCKQCACTKQRKRYAKTKVDAVSPDHYAPDSMDAMETIIDGLPAREGACLLPILKYYERRNDKGQREIDLAKANNYAHRLVYGHWRDDKRRMVTFPPVEIFPGLMGQLPTWAAINVQLTKVDEELRETIQAAMECDREAFLEELSDALQAIGNLVSVAKISGEELREYRDKVYAKNKKRGRFNHD